MSDTGIIGARQFFDFDANFVMHHGGQLVRPRIAYETWGVLNKAGDNAVLLFTGLSPSAHAASSVADSSPGWWEEMIGPGRPIDTNRLFIICINSLGSCFGSTGPDSIDQIKKERYSIDFPVLSLEDIAASADHVVTALGVNTLHAVVGCSMGGMSALAYCVQFPGKTEQLVSVSSAARALPFAIAMRSLQREMVRKDPDWLGGRYPADARPINGMRMARKLGMVTYRSAKEWEMRFGRERVSEERDSCDPFCIDFEVESYLDAHAKKFTGGFDPNCYLFLSRAMDLFDMADYGGSVETGVARMKIKRALVVGVHTDILFPLPQQRELAAALEAAGCDVDFSALDSIQGHDSFLVDMDRFRPVIGNWFEQNPPKSAKQA